MAKEPFEPFEQFAMPNEVRAFVEQSVTQARVAFDGIACADRDRDFGANRSARAAGLRATHLSRSGLSLDPWLLGME